jgi:hypothetical protein
LKDARVWGTVLSGRVFQAQRGLAQGPTEGLKTA